MSDQSLLESNGSLAIKKESLHDQVANRIRDLIIEGILEPGSRIDENVLLKQMGVSRTPFREALRTLAAEGLVNILPSRGSRVRKLAPEEVHSMLEVLGHLERLAGQLACVRASDAELKGLVDLHERMTEFYKVRDRMPYYKLNQEFHTRLTALSKNATLFEMQANIQGRLKRVRYIGSSKPSDWEAALAEHEEMVAAIRRRDGDRLGEIMAQHLENTWTRVRDSIAKQHEDTNA